MSLISVRQAPVQHDSVSQPAAVQPLQHHRLDRDQGVRLLQKRPQRRHGHVDAGAKPLRPRCLNNAYPVVRPPWVPNDLVRFVLDPMLQERLQGHLLCLGWALLRRLLRLHVLLLRWCHVYARFERTMFLRVSKERFFMQVPNEPR